MNKSITETQNFYEKMQYKEAVKTGFYEFQVLYSTNLEMLPLLVQQQSSYWFYVYGHDNFGLNCKEIYCFVKLSIYFTSLLVIGLSFTHI